jgi:integrating conjugative element protein (TIGR03758 family)
MLNDTSRCHGSSVNYAECMQNAFAQGSPNGVADTGAHFYLITSVTAAIILMVIAWVLLSLYSTWSSGNMKFNSLIVLSVKAITILTISIFLVVP